VRSLYAFWPLGDRALGSFMQGTLIRQIKNENEVLKDDEMRLSVSIDLKTESLVLEFDEPMKMVSVPKDVVIKFAQMLIQRAQELK
jgi:hypothetical protein